MWIHWCIIQIIIKHYESFNFYYHFYIFIISLISLPGTIMLQPKDDDSYIIIFHPLLYLVYLICFYLLESFEMFYKLLYLLIYHSLTFTKTLEIQVRINIPQFTLNSSLFRTHQKHRFLFVLFQFLFEIILQNMTRYFPLIFILVTHQSFFFLSQLLLEIFKITLNLISPQK